MSLVLSALVVALQMIDEKCGTLKWKKKIVIITNGTGFMDLDDLDNIRDKINQEGVELVIL